MLSSLVSADNDSAVDFPDGVGNIWAFSPIIRLVDNQSTASTDVLPTSTSASVVQPVAFDSVRFLLPLTLLVVFNLVVVVGNSMVVAAVFTHRKLRTVTNVFIVSLATSDLMLGLLVLPSSSAYELLGNRWPFGAVWCQAWLAIDVWLCTASILNLVAISLDRYLAISRPFRYPTLMSPARARVAVAVVWTLALAICLPPLLGWRDSSSAGASLSLPDPFPDEFFVDRNWNWSEKINSVYNSSSLSRNIRSISSLNGEVNENSLLQRVDQSNNLTAGYEITVDDAIDSHHFTKPYQQQPFTSAAELLHLPTLDDVITSSALTKDITNETTTARSTDLSAAHSAVRNSKALIHFFQDTEKVQNQGDTPLNVNDAVFDTTGFTTYDSLLTPGWTQIPPVTQTGSSVDENELTTAETEDDSQYPVCALTSEPGYIIYSACGSFWIPMFVMVFFYVKIYRTAVRATNALRRGVVRTKAAAGPGCGSGPSSTSSAAESSLVNLRVHRGGRNESTAHSSTWSTSVRLSNGGATNESFVGGNFSRNSSQTALIPDLRLRGSVVDTDSYQRTSRCNGNCNSSSGTETNRTERLSLASAADASAGGAGFDSVKQNYDVISMAVVSATNGCGATRSPEANAAKGASCSYGTETVSNCGARSKSRGIFSSSTTKGSSDIMSVHRFNRRQRSSATSGTAESEFTSGSDDRRRTTRFRRSLATSDLDDDDDDGDLMTSAPVSRAGSSCGAATGSNVGGIENLLRSALTPVYENCTPAGSAETPGTPGAAAVHSRRVLVNIRTQLRRLNREKKAAKTVGIIVGCFVFCWTPFFAVYVLGAFCVDCTPAVAFTVFFWLGYCNSAINPFVYALCSRDFRDAFRRLLRCGRSGNRQSSAVSGALAFGSTTTTTSFRASRIGTSLNVDESRVGAVGAAAAGLAMAVARGLGRRRSRRQCRPNSDDFTASICRH